MEDVIARFLVAMRGSPTTCNPLERSRGSVHLVEDDGLRLAGAVILPEKVQQVVEWVPSGKGMAGQALLRGEPVSTCNLKDDPSGAVRPGAKAVDAQAAVAMSVRNSANDIIAVLGFAFADQREFTPDDLANFAAKAVSLASTIEASGLSGATIAVIATDSSRPPAPRSPGWETRCTRDSAR
jgi:L-methionine (R)-S-oxide reductase